MVLQDNIDAEAATRAAADVVLQDNIDAEVATRESLIRREAGVIHIGASSFIMDDTDPTNHRISTSSGKLTLTSDEGVVEVDGRLAVGSVTDVEGAIVDHEGRITANETTLVNHEGRISTNESNIASNRSAISRNARNIAANRSMILENRQAIAANSAAISSLDKKLGDVESKAYAGIAAAASLASVVSPTETGKTSVTSGVAFYEGEAAVGVNATHRMNVSENQDLYINAGVSVTSDSTVLGRVLLGTEF